MFKAIKKCRENLLHYAFLRKKTDMKVERSMITRAILGSESRSKQEVSNDPSIYVLNLLPAN